MTRPWAVGMSLNCQHNPRCANIYEAESGIDVTFPCAGLGLEDAAMIVAAVNAVVPECVGDAIKAEIDRVNALVSQRKRLDGVRFE